MDAVKSTIFHSDWWLNAVTADNWTEALVEKGGQVVGLLRYSINRQGPFTVCRMPPLTRVLGPVVTVGGKKPESRQGAVFGVVGELLAQMPRCDYVKFILPPSFGDALPFQVNGFRAGVQHTFILNCRSGLDALWGGMRDKTRNVIRRAQDRLTLAEIDDPQDFMAYYRANLPMGRSYFDLALIPKLVKACRRQGCGKVIAATDAEGVRHAAIFLIWDSETCYYFLSTRSKDIADAGAVSLLVWEGIKHAQALGLDFDFDGVTSESRLQFFLGFGGEAASRLIVEKGGLLYDVQRAMREYKSRLVGKPLSTFY